MTGESHSVIKENNARDFLKCHGCRLVKSKCCCTPNKGPPSTYSNTPKGNAKLERTNNQGSLLNIGGVNHNVLIYYLFRLSAHAIEYSVFAKSELISSIA